MIKGSAVYQNINFELALKSSYGFALRPFYKINEDFEVFGRVGKYVNNFKITYSTYSSNETYYHTLYSIGTAYKINNNFNATLDYTKLNNKGNVDASLIGIGLRYNY